MILAELRLGQLAEVGEGQAREAIARLRQALAMVDLADLDEATRDRTRTHPPAAWWGTLLARVASGLQRAAGAEDPTGRLVLSAPADDRWTVAITFDEEDVGIDAARDAARVLRDVLRGDDPEIAATVDALRALHEEARPDASTRMVIDAARRRGIPIRRSLDTDVVQLGLGTTQRRIAGATTDRTSAAAVAIADSTRRMRRVLSGVGLPLSVRDRARSRDDALGVARDIGFPVRLIVNGRVIPTAPLDDEAALRSEWERLRDGDDVLLEHVVEGTTLRVLVVDGRVVSRLPADAAAAMHPAVRAACELAVNAVGLDIAEVELRTPDASEPLRANGGIIAAVHASPDLAAHGAAAGDAVVRMLYPAGAPFTIPVTAVTGTNGKTTTTRLTAHLFRQTGRTVGFTTTDGVYLGEQLLMQGDLTGPFAANLILSHRAVEVAVLETARGGILKSGLGFDACDAAIVMNVSADHLGLGGIDTVEHLADVKAVLPSMVKPTGCAVLNGDDPLVLRMRERTRGRVALFSTVPAGTNADVEAHLASGGIVARVEQADGREHLMIIQGAERIDLGAADDVPLTFGGLARFQIQNVLAAATAAWVQGVTPDEIRRGLRSFLPSAAATPGRLNVVETPRGRVLLDYAHNPAAIEGLFTFVRAMPARRRMALLSAPGDRRDQDLREIGRLATGVDLVIMKEHEVYRRGRAPGVIAELMADGLRETGFPADRILTFTEEHDAVAHVMSLMEPGDVVIIIADDTKAVERQLAAMR